MKAVININVADIRMECKFRSERVSQALFNESVDFTEKRDGYCLVKCRDGYSGWIGEQFLSEIENSDELPSLVVIKNLAFGYEKPDRNSRRVTAIPYGSRITKKPEKGFIRVESARYGDFFLAGDDLLESIPKNGVYAFTPETLITEAERFLGTPYLWGGRTYFGIDCSGFSQLIFGMMGVNLPRDSRDQRKLGEETARDDIQIGDLLFFPGHVGIAISESSMIHSSSTNGGVSYNSFKPGGERYAESYDKNLQTIRRIVS